MYNEQKANVLWQERIKMLITKVQKKHKNITGLKLRPTITKKRKLREVVRKRGKVPLYLYFHPQASELWDCWLAEWAFALKFQVYGKNMVQQVWNFDPQSPRRGNWGMSWGREGRFPYTNISTPKIRNCEIVNWLNRLLLWSFSSLGRTWPLSFESDWGFLYWTWGALSDWFMVNRRGSEPQV